MLEHDLIELFDHQASEDPPPVYASIAGAARRGQIRRRQRRITLTAAPLAAAVAVLAIAMGGTFLAPSPAPAPPAQSQSHQVPSLYLLPRWLPLGTRLYGGTVYPWHEEDLSIVKGKSVVGAISTFTAHCSVRLPKLSCSGQVSWGPLSGRAGTINGFPAYWSEFGLLVQRRLDQWVIVRLGARADEMDVARHLTAHVPAIRYPAQLTGSWPGLRVQNVGVRFARGRAVATGLTLAGAATRSPAASRPPYQNVVEVDVTTVGSTPGCISAGAHEVINGYHVDVSWIDRHSADPIEDVCANDADGFQVRAHSYGKHLFAAAPVVFAHLKLFGPDPAKWPATPFG